MYKGTMYNVQMENRSRHGGKMPPRGRLITGINSGAKEKEKAKEEKQKKKNKSNKKSRTKLCGA